MKLTKYDPEQFDQAVRTAQRAANESGERAWLLSNEDSGVFHAVLESRFFGADFKNEVIEKLVYPSGTRPA